MALVTMTTKQPIDKCAPAEAEDDDSWQEVMDEQQWRSGQATVVDGEERWRLS
jgi:hypothetical protein